MNAQIGIKNQSTAAAQKSYITDSVISKDGTLIAFDRFHAPIPGASLPIMALYWLGQWGIAASTDHRALQGHY